MVNTDSLDCPPFVGTTVLPKENAAISPGETSPVLSETRVVIVSDDWYYMVGLYIALLGKKGFFVEFVFVQHVTEELFNNRSLRVDSSFRDNVLIIAVSDISVVRRIPDFPLFRVLVLLGSPKGKDVSFLYLNVFFVSRYISIHRLCNFLMKERIDKKIIARKLYLTPHEQRIVFSYFSIHDRKTLSDYLQLRRKSISNCKMSVFRKLHVSSNAEAYLIMRAIMEVKCKTLLLL